MGKVGVAIVLLCLCWGCSGDGSGAGDGGDALDVPGDAGGDLPGDPGNGADACAGPNPASLQGCIDELCPAGMRCPAGIPKKCISTGCQCGDGVWMCLTDCMGSTKHCTANPPCKVHGDCEADERCVEGVCRDRPQECPVAAPSGACTALLSEADCTAAQGTWVCDPAPCVPPDEPAPCRCSCPTTDSTCPCWADDQCQGYCDFPVAALPDEAVCRGIATCSARRFKPQWGCQCVEGTAPDTWATVMCSC